MGYIYKITNTVNGKVYIGQTVRTPMQRWKEHVKNGKTERNYGHNKHLYGSMRLYGVDAFTFEVIEECENQILDEREKYWIKYYKCFDGMFGYNLTFGGAGGANVDYDLVRALWDDGFSSGEISNRLGISQSCVVSILKEHPSYSSQEGLNRGLARYKNNNGVQVSKYDMDGNLIEIFATTHDAARSVSGTSSSICSCCKGRINHVYGFQWRYVDDAPPGKFQRKRRDWHEVIQYDMDWNELQRFENIKRASRATGASTSGISDCCRGKRNECGGYRWASAS